MFFFNFAIVVSQTLAIMMDCFQCFTSNLRYILSADPLKRDSYCRKLNRHLHGMTQLNNKRDTGPFPP